MTSYPDPLSNHDPRALEVRGYQWWSSNTHRNTRAAKQWETVREKLALGDWAEPTAENPKQGVSLMAWRALWSVDRHGWLAKGIEEGLVPEDTNLDWWGDHYRRGQALRKLFLPTFPVPRGEAARAVYDAEEADRQALLALVEERWPQLLDWYMTGATARVESLYKHPLVFLARPESQQTLASLLNWKGFEPLLEASEGKPALATPGQLLSLALARRCQPMLEFSLSKGASPDDPVKDFKGNERSMLHEAIFKADPHARDWLLEQGVQLETWDRMARTPFLTAARMADVETMEKLVAYGANPHATDRFGQTAVHLVIEGIRTTNLNKDYFRATGKFEYEDKTPLELDQTIERAAQALAFLARLGVDFNAPALETPKNTKRNPSPFASLPRAQRGQLSAKPGEMWTDQLDRRLAEDMLLAPSTVARLRDAVLTARLDALVPPEPEEFSMDPVLDIPVPKVSRRPRL